MTDESKKNRVPFVGDLLHLISPPPSVQDTEAFYARATEVLTDGAIERRHRRRVIVERIDMVGNAVFWLMTLVAVGWAIGRLVDNRPPYSDIGYHMAQDSIPAGGDIRLDIDVTWQRICTGQLRWSIRDDDGDVRTFGPVPTYVPSHLGPDHITRRFHIPANMSDGEGTIQFSASYTCDGSILTRPWRTIEVSVPPIGFTITHPPLMPPGSDATSTQ